MKTERPKFRRVYVEAKDGLTNRRKCATFYDCTPEEVIAAIKAAAESIKANGAKRRDPQPA